MAAPSLSSAPRAAARPETTTRAIQPTTRFRVRYDDPYFVQNITYATNAGMFAGPYHFGRMDIIERTRPTPTESQTTAPTKPTISSKWPAPWMRPGYLLPVFDFEAGTGIRTPSELAQFAIDFSDRIYEVKGIRPAVYIGSNYAQPDEQHSRVG